MAHCPAKPGESSPLPQATSVGAVAVPWREGYTVSRKLRGPQCRVPGPSSASGSLRPLTARDSGKQSSVDHSSHMALPPSPSQAPELPDVPFIQKEFQLSPAGGTRGGGSLQLCSLWATVHSCLTLRSTSQVACRVQKTWCLLAPRGARCGTALAGSLTSGELALESGVPGRRARPPVSCSVWGRRFLSASVFSSVTWAPELPAGMGLRVHRKFCVTCLASGLASACQHGQGLQGSLSPLPQVPNFHEKSRHN